MELQCSGNHCLKYHEKVTGSVSEKISLKHHPKMEKSEGENKKEENILKLMEKIFPSLMKNINMEMQESQNIRKVRKYMRVHT